MPTSLKLPAKLKARVTMAARRTGKSPHAFMLDAIEQGTSREERRQRFIADALAAEADAIETGRAYPADEVHAFVSGLAKGARTARPRAKSWRK